MLYGEPGVGKSSSAVRIAQACMRKMYGTFNDHDMVAINETDKFQSEFRTFHRVILFDDIDASRPDAADSISPFHKVIDYVNNIEKTALNPNVDMKGKVHIRPDLVILTTNRKCDGPANIGAEYVRSKGALARRTNYAIHLHTGYLRCSIKTCHSITSECSDTYGNQAEYRPLPRYQDVDREVMYDFISNEFMKYHKEQEEFIVSMNMNFDNLNKKVHVEVVAEDDVLDSQAGLSSLLSDERILSGSSIDFKKKYYAERVDWEFFIAHISSYYLDGPQYVLAPDGRVLPECRSGSEPSYKLWFYVQILNEYVLNELNLEFVYIDHEWKFNKLEVLSNDNCKTPETVEENLCSDDPLQTNIIDSSELPRNDDDSLVCTDMSEDLQINTALSCFNNIKWCPIRTLKYVKHGTLEIDLIVEYDEVIFVVECKRSRSGAPRGKKQAKRSSALVHYYCGKRTIGLIYDYFGFKLVCDYGQQINIHGYKAFLKRVPYSDYLFNMGDAASSQTVSLRNIPDISSYIIEGFELNSDLVFNYVL
jgi:hypothetical protein